MKQKITLLRQSVKLTMLGRTLERERKKAARRIAKRNYPLSSAEAQNTVKRLNNLCVQWQGVEKEYLRLRAELEASRA